MQAEDPTSSLFTGFFSIILPTLEHGVWSLPPSVKQMILETFIDNLSTYFFSLCPLGFYLSMGTLCKTGEKVTALSYRE